MINKDVVTYFNVLKKRIYKPLEPWVSPFVNLIKLRRVLVLGVLLSLGGMSLGGWKVKPQERAAWWPWLSRSHSGMSLAWFESGEEEESLRELGLANGWQLSFKKNSQVFEMAKKRVDEPEKIREMVFRWGEVLGESDHYKDGWLRLAELEYAQYNSEGAYAAFEEGRYLDPVGENTLLIKELIKN